MSRECLDCKACCWAPEVEGVTSVASWCEHCDIQASLGCRIYDERPKACAEFECLWRSDDFVPEDLSPKKARIMVTATDSRSLLIWELTPGAAGKKKVRAWLEEMAADGAKISIGNPRAAVI